MPIVKKNEKNVQTLFTNLGVLALAIPRRPIINRCFYAFRWVLCGTLVSKITTNILFSCTFWLNKYVVELPDVVLLEVALGHQDQDGHVSMPSNHYLNEKNIIWSKKKIPQPKHAPVDHPGGDGLDDPQDARINLALCFASKTLQGEPILKVSCKSVHK